MSAGDEQSGSSPSAAGADDVVPLEPIEDRLTEAVEAAQLLEPNDRVRLVTRLWESLPAKHRAEIVWFGIENLQTPAEENSGPAIQKQPEPVGFDLHRLLFDPSNTSQLYSAPRRFDLATIFVVTAAYSMLFGAISALSYKDMGPPVQVAVGILVTFVGIAQAYFKETANPRGVSIVAGAVALSIILIFIHVSTPRVFGESIVLVVFFGGLPG